MRDSSTSNPPNSGLSFPLHSACKLESSFFSSSYPPPCLYHRQLKETNYIFSLLSRIFLATSASSFRYIFCLPNYHRQKWLSVISPQQAAVPPVFNYCFIIFPCRCLPFTPKTDATCSRFLLFL